MDYQIIRSRRKTIAIQILPGNRVVVRCPAGMPEEEISRFVQSKHAWLEKHRLPEEACLPPLTQAQLRLLTRQAKAVIPQRVAHYGQLLGVTWGRVTIRTQHTRWGSCSGRGNLNFNCLLMLAPEQVLDYVVVHELCHRREMNHSPRFWALVEKVLPDYRQRKQWLKDNGTSLLSRLADE